MKLCIIEACWIQYCTRSVTRSLITVSTEVTFSTSLQFTLLCDTKRSWTTEVCEKTEATDPAPYWSCQSRHSAASHVHDHAHIPDAPQLLGQWPPRAYGSYSVEAWEGLSEYTANYLTKGNSRTVPLGCISCLHSSSPLDDNVVTDSDQVVMLVVGTVSRLHVPDTVLVHAVQNSMVWCHITV